MPPTNLINLAIVDDHTLFRKALKNYLSGQGNIQVVIQSPDIRDLFRRLENSCVHVLLMDIFMPNIDGLEAAMLIRNEYPDIKILALSMCTDVSLLNDLLDAGVYGILSKTDEPEELIRAILSVSEGKIYRNKLFTEVLYWNKQIDIKKYNGNGSDVMLNEREKKVLQLLWDEKNNKEIAEHLFLGVRSVEKIRQDLKEKLNIKSTVGLLKYAINKKIIKINAQSYSDFFTQNK